MEIKDTYRIMGRLGRYKRSGMHRNSVGRFATIFIKSNSVWFFSEIGWEVSIYRISRVSTIRISSVKSYQVTWRFLCLQGIVTELSQVWPMTMFSCRRSVITSEISFTLSIDSLLYWSWITSIDHIYVSSYISRK